MEHIHEANERITPLVAMFMNNKHSWEGPASKLQELLSVRREGGLVPPANHLSRKLMEHRDKLFCLGVDVELRRTARGRLVSLKRTNMGPTEVTVTDNSLKALENDSRGDVTDLGMTVDFIGVVCVKCTEFEPPETCHYTHNRCSPSGCFMPVVRAAGKLWEGK